MLIRVIAVLLLLTTMASWAIEPASACSCVPRDPGEMVERSEAAFIGRVVSRVEPPRGEIWSSADLVTYTFAVESVAKGNLPEFVEVLSPISGVSCGFGDVVQEGSRLAITLWTDNGGNYRSGFCSTMVPSEMASESVMREPAPGQISIVPSPVPSTDGEVSEEPATVGVLPESEPKPIDPTVVPSPAAEQSAEPPGWYLLAIIGPILIVLALGGYGVLVHRRRTPIH